MSKVAIVKCNSYNDKEVKQAVETGLSLIGGIEKFVSSNETVLLKPNLLVGDNPEKCVTTHPAVFKAVAELVKDKCKNLTYGDSPAFGSTLGAAKKSGLVKVADELGIKISDFKEGREIFAETAVQNKKFKIANAVLDNDAIISLPKLKTHGLEKYTGCVKNQFGCVPGALKGEFHVKLPDAFDFAKMLVDLNNFINPRLYIMDGIGAMEGNGPRGGNRIDMNILLFSDDPIALDATVCRIIDLDPQLVPTIIYGNETGAGDFKEDKIEILGESIESIKKSNFKIDRNPIKPFKATKIARFVSNRLTKRPFINEDLCVKCGVCVDMCPVNPKGVDWADGNKNIAPKYNYSNCIRCYCCQEVCPESIISLKSPIIRKIVDLFNHSDKEE